MPGRGDDRLMMTTHLVAFYTNENCTAEGEMYSTDIAETCRTNSHGNWLSYMITS